MTRQRISPSFSRRAFATGLALSPFAVTAAQRDGVARQASPEVDAGVFRFTFGDAKAFVFDTDTWPLGITFAASNATFDEQQALTKEFGAFTMSVNATLVDTGNHLMILDTGPDGLLVERVENVGYKPEDVDLIIVSHMHYDHVNGVFPFGTRKELAFPNARYVVSNAEYNYWIHDDGRPVSDYAAPNMGVARADAKRFIVVLGDKLEPAEWGEEVLPGVKLVEAIGHTGGHAAVEVTSGDETLLHVGDLILNPILNLEHPEWIIAPAVWYEEDLTSRRRLMDRAAEEHLLIQTVHFPFPGVGYVEKDGDAWAWVPLT